MTLKSQFLFSCLSLLLLTACTSYKNVPYFQTKELQGEREIALETYYKENVVRFQPDDILSIKVFFPREEEIMKDFNLFSASGGGQERESYQIDKNGNIQFPFLGEVKVAGYTKEELETYFRVSLIKYLEKAHYEDLIVTVDLKNFKIFVLGEVNAPGQISVTKSQINIMEAIAMAGDLSIYGKRDNVRIVRQMPNGEVKIVQLDVSKAGVISSPYFYLSQNDLIYIEPSKVKTRGADLGASTSFVFTILSTVMSVTTFVLMLTRK
ncbi:MAG: polysaccharide export protein [Dysgonamonadaceae bacterium]|jgi:polysaccharide export outer membrane protein|nr:polysaccharide export protein [Dysgonamonadaceae bacterium]